VIEVHDVIVHGVGGENDVADVLRVERYLQPHGVLHRSYRGNGMDGRAHPAETLGEQPRIPWVAALEDVLDATPHLAGRPRVLDLAPIDLDIDAKVALDSGDRIDDDALAHIEILTSSKRPRERRPESGKS
jgi:hypothetical protein